MRAAALDKILIEEDEAKAEEARIKRRAKEIRDRIKKESRKGGY